MDIMSFNTKETLVVITYITSLKPHNLVRHRNIDSYYELFDEHLGNKDSILIWSIPLVKPSGVDNVVVEIVIAPECDPKERFGQIISEWTIPTKKT